MFQGRNTSSSHPFDLRPSQRNIKITYLWDKITESIINVQKMNRMKRKPSMCCVLAEFSDGYANQESNYGVSPYEKTDTLTSQPRYNCYIFFTILGKTGNM